MFRFIALLLVLIAPWVRADSAADKLTIAGINVFTNAYRAWDRGRFTEAVGLFQKACASSSATATNYYWLGVGQFHLALQILGLPKSDAHQAAADQALDAAVAALDHAVQLDNGQAESHALLGTIYGMQIGEKWVRAVWLGPGVQKQQELAMAAGTNDARVEYLLGTSKFYCATSDSARREALTTLLAAEKLFVAETGQPAGPLEPRWGHDSCLTFIGSCYEKLNQPADAEKYFRKALAIHPEDGLAQAGLARVTKTTK